MRNDADEDVYVPIATAEQLSLPRASRDGGGGMHY